MDTSYEYFHLAAAMTKMNPKHVSRNNTKSGWYPFQLSTSQWRHNELDGVSNHKPREGLLKRLFTRKSKKTSKLCVTGICVGNSPVTSEFPAQRASNAENGWRHHETGATFPKTRKYGCHTLCYVSNRLENDESCYSKKRIWTLAFKMVAFWILQWFFGLSPHHLSIDIPWFQTSAKILVISHGNHSSRERSLFWNIITNTSF